MTLVALVDLVALMTLVISGGAFGPDDPGDPDSLESNMINAESSFTESSCITHCALCSAQVMVVHWEHTAHIGQTKKRILPRGRVWF